MEKAIVGSLNRSTFFPGVVRGIFEGLKNAKRSYYRNHEFRFGKKKI